MALYSLLFTQWKMNPVKNEFHVDFLVHLQEEFSPVGYFAIPGRDGAGGCRACRDIEGLSPSFHFGDAHLHCAQAQVSRRGRNSIPFGDSPFKARESTRRPALSAVEGSTGCLSPC